MLLFSSLVNTLSSRGYIANWAGCVCAIVVGIYVRCIAVYCATYRVCIHIIINTRYTCGWKEKDKDSAVTPVRRVDVYLFKYVLRSRKYNVLRSFSSLSKLPYAEVV